MMLLHLLTARAALTLADSECADWLARPTAGEHPRCARCGEPICGCSDPEYAGVVILPHEPVSAAPCRSSGAALRGRARFVST